MKNWAIPELIAWGVVYANLLFGFIILANQVMLHADSLNYINITINW